MRRTTTSPVFVGSPTSVAIRIPFGKAGLSFQASASGVTLVKACCAIAELANAIKAAATKDFFILASSPMDVACRPKLHEQVIPCLEHGRDRSLIRSADSGPKRIFRGKLTHYPHPSFLALT